MNHHSQDPDVAEGGEAVDHSRTDGFAAMGILALTVVFIVVVLVALL